MPLILAPVGLVVAGMGIGEMKTGFIRGLISKGSKKAELDEPDDDKKGAPKGATSYRRRSSR